MTMPPSNDFLALQQALAGRYSLTRELGRGGMGIVYLAQEVRLDRPVALKVLPPERATRDERERFLREARTAARLSHPHIVPIHSVHEVGYFVLFAMSYIEGETLGERIRATGPLPPRDAARILREVGWALAYAHAQGVVHRDVKPDNILIESGSGRAVVTDFGIAHVGASDLTAETGLVGTAEFMSPEQARGEQADERSDLYALGIVGYYMLSGRLPFHGATSTETLAMHLTESAPTLGSIVPGLPAPLTQAVDRCLARNPAQRFANGEEFAGALGRALEERRELPHALRHFMKQNRDSSSAIIATEVFSVGSIGVWATIFATELMEFELVPLLAPMAVWFALGATPIAMLTQMARRLLRAGYDQPDLVRAMREDLDQHAEEIARGSERSRLDNWLKRLTAGGLGLHVAGLGWLAFGPWVEGAGVALGVLLGLSGTAWVAAGSAAAARHHLRGRPPGRGWLRFWEGVPGRALFRAARIRLEPMQSGAPYGPTELAIGLAADRLFAALPTNQRDAFPELPDVVRRLEADAERMRTHMKDLDAVIADAGDTAGDASDATSAVLLNAHDRSGAPAAELKEMRARAEDRLRDIVAALETLRIELLRMHAGAASAASVTIDLNAARDVSSDVARLLEGTREVERFLGRRPARELATTPTPA